MKKEWQELAERRARERRLRVQAERRLWKTCALALVLGLTAGLYCSHPVLVRPVRPECDGSPCPPEVKRAVQPLTGRQWVLVRCGAVARRLNDLPVVRRATVRKWPPGEVTVRIEKRIPLAALRTPTHTFLLDREGVIFHDAAVSLSSLPLLLGDRFRGLQPGDRLADGDLRRIEDCLAGVRSAGLPPVKKLVVTDFGAVTLYTSGPLCFRLGRRDLRRKLVLAACAMKQLRRKGKESGTFDLRVLGASTWSPHVS